MATELEVYMGLFGEFEVVRLVVKEDCEVRLVDGGSQFLHTFAMKVGTVIASDDDEGVVNQGAGVAEQMDACITIELLCFGAATVVFVIAQTGIDWSLEAVELCCHIFLDEGMDAEVDDVASDEDEVRPFGVDKVNPSGEFAAWVVIAEMEVAQHDDFVVLWQWFGCAELKRHTHFVFVVQVAIKEDTEKKDADACKGVPVGVEARTGDEVYDPAKVKQEEEHDEIEHDEDGRSAYLVNSLSSRKGKRIGFSAEVDEQTGKAEDA